MKRWVRRLLQLLSLALFGLILWWAGPEPWRQILTSDWRPLSVGLLLYGAVSFLAALRLRLVSRSLLKRNIASRRRFFYLHMIARALGFILPRGLSALGGKSVGLRALGLSLRRSLWIVMTDNLYDVLSLALVSIPALFFLQGQLGRLPFALLAAALWALLGLGIWIAVAGNRLGPLLAGVLDRLPWLARRLEIDDARIEQLFPAPRPALQALLWTILIALLMATTYYAIALAIGLSAPWWLFAAAFPITQLSLIIAVAPGGLGILDLGWLGLLRLGGLPQTEALTFVVAQRAFMVVFVLLWTAAGTLLSLTESRELPSIRVTENHGGAPLPEQTD